MSVTIVPEPADAEREAILATLARPEEDSRRGWAEAALLEGVEGGEPDP